MSWPTALQVLRLVLVGALVAAALALPSIGELLERKRLARLLALGMLSAAVFLGAHYAQRASMNPAVVVPVTRLVIMAVLSWAPLAIALLAETRGTRAHRGLLVGMALICLTPWLGDLAVRSETMIHTRPFGDRVLAARAGPLFPLLAVYGVLACAYVARGFHLATSLRGMARRRLLAAMMVVNLLGVANDVLLVLDLAPTLAVLDIAVGIDALVLVGVLQATVRTTKRRLDARIDETTAELSEAQKQLLTADRLASLGTLAAGVAHEINNPLTYITSNLELARSRVTDPEVADMLDDAIEGTQRVSHIVDGLGAFARRPGTQEDGHVDVADVVRTALELVRHELRHRAVVTVDVPANLPQPPGDEGELVQVLVNLLINAAHAIDDAPERSAHEITITAALEDEHVVIMVQDSGCGIPDEIRDRLTEPFFTTKALGRGTGLGLSICHGIVEALGGTLELDNRPQGGASARVTLPVGDDAPLSTATLASASSSPPPPSAKEAGSEPSGLRVLLVDDDAMVRRSVLRMLRDHDVTAATSGHEALERCAEQRFDVILCDVMMPGMSG
ncbi:MAG TPA: response regulator, partial [Polyangiaceae bacterium]|nr:response regulator [Polyangiaceae bacterium]